MQFQSKVQVLSSQAEKNSQKIYGKHKRPEVALDILNRRNTAGDIIVSSSKLCYRAIVTETSWHWPKEWHTDQWNRTEDPNTTSQSYNYYPWHSWQDTHWEKPEFPTWYRESKFQYREVMKQDSHCSPSQNPMLVTSVTSLPSQNSTPIRPVTSSLDLIPWNWKEKKVGKTP